MDQSTTDKPAPAPLPPVDISRHYFYSIDGLRLIASVNIILFHLDKIGGLLNVAHTGWFFRVVQAPAFHASVFFILGGFIFTAKFIAKAETFSVRKFLVGRLIDLYPLHAGMTIIMVPVTIFTALAAGVYSTGLMAYSVLMHLGLGWSFFPLRGYTLNSPSWALSAFFLCYLLFGPAMRLVRQLHTRKQVVGAMAVCMVPSSLWAALYLGIGNVDYYQFFHLFAPIRFFEFALGMLLARLFQVSHASAQRTRWWHHSVVNDLLIVLTVGLVYLNAKYWGNPDQTASLRWISYHVVMLPLYCVLMYRFACGNGIVCRVFAFTPIRLVGRSSFYPYLIHIPLISWLTWVLENRFNYNEFLFSPVNITLFMVVLYIGSTLYSEKVKRVIRVKYTKTSTSGKG